MLMVAVTAMPYAPARRLELPKGKHQGQASQQQQPVDLRHVDLPLDLARRVDDAHTGQQAHLDGLLGEGVHPGDHGLGSDDGSHCCEQYHRIKQEWGSQTEEGIGGEFRLDQQQGSLPEIVAQKGGPYEAYPGCSYGLFGEVAQVRIEGLCTGDAEHD